MPALNKRIGRGVQAGGSALINFYIETAIVDVPESDNKIEEDLK